MKSKDFYVRFRYIMTKDIPVVTNYLQSHCNVDDFTFVFRTKIVLENEIKLKEFNYKVLHGIFHLIKILSSGNSELLMNVMCVSTNKVLSIYCGSVAMLSPYGKKVEDVCAFKITLDKILRIEDCYKQDRILTLISFLINKEWLLLSLENKKRQKYYQARVLYK